MSGRKRKYNIDVLQSHDVLDNNSSFELDDDDFHTAKTHCIPNLSIASEFDSSNRAHNSRHLSHYCSGANATPLNDPHNLSLIHI